MESEDENHVVRKIGKIDSGEEFYHRKKIPNQSKQPEFEI